MSKENSKEKVQGVLLGHYSCPECGSNDNLAVYVKTDDNGVETIDGSCFTPNCKTYWTEKELKELGVLDENFEAPKGLKPPKKEKITLEEYKALQAITTSDTVQPDGSLYRGITTEIATLYGHLYVRDKDGWIVREYYPETRGSFLTDKSTLVGYKSKTLPKRYGTHNIGITGIGSDFSGQMLFKSGGRAVVICGGENDKLAAAQMFAAYQKQRNNEDYKSYAVVSVTAGEGGLEKQCREQYDWLDTFDEIILCMDNDTAGKEATEAALRVLPDDKVKVMTTSLKDANAMLAEGMQRQFISDFFSAKSVSPDEVKTSKDADSEIDEELARPKVPLPPFMKVLQSKMAGGIPLGYIINLGAETGGGKCLGKDTPVLMYDMSVKNVQDVVVGDLLMGDDGTPRKVLSVTTGKEQMYKVNQNKGISYEVNASHILSLRASFSTKDYAKGQTVNINIEDYLALGSKAKRALKGYKGSLVNYNVFGIDEPRAYLLGLWLAEGSSADSRITVNNEMIDILQAEVASLGYNLHTVYEDTNCTTYNIKGGFYKWLRELDLLNNKHFPKWLLGCSQKTRQDVLAGYLDGDGYLHNNGYEVVAKQQELSNTFNSLCKSLGLRTNQKIVKKTAQNNFEGLYYKTSVYGATHQLPLRLNRKKSVFKDTSPTGNTGISVEKLGVDTYYGFEIDGNRLFCLGDLTVTHNTTIVNEMIYYWLFNSPHKIGILSLELTAGQYQIALLSRHIGYKINLIENPKDAVAFVNQPDILAKRKSLRENDFGEERYALIDERSGSLISIKKQITKLIKKYDCKVIVIDPINDLFEGVGLEEQTGFIKFLKEAVKLGITFVNICHITKGKTATDKNGNRIVRKLTENDFSGVSNLVKSGGCNITATRDKLADLEEDKNTTEIEVLKCRWTGHSGFAGNWYYDNATHTLYDKDEYFGMQQNGY